MSDNPVALLQERLKLYSDKVIKNTTIITPGEINQNFLLHIAKSKFTSFTPVISKRAGSTEDNTLPRVHTAATLLNCIKAYAGVSYYATSAPPVLKVKPDSYLGGFYIYKIPFEVALKPNKQLVYDAATTDECWLVSYSPETRAFDTTVAGKFLPMQSIYVPVVGKYPSSITTYAVEINDPQGIPLTKEVYLKQGWWKLEIKGETQLLSVAKLTQAEFDEEHKLKASMLSYSESPAFAKW